MIQDDSQRVPPMPEHFGDPAAEYAAVRATAGIALRTDRGQLRLFGKDPVKMVQGLITNDIAEAATGQGVFAAMLTPKGRTIAEMRVFRREREEGVEVLMDLPSEAMPGARDHLRKYVPPMFARWADVSDDLAVVGTYGPLAHDVVERSLGSAVEPLDEDAFVEVLCNGDPALLVGTRAVGGERGYELFGSPASASAFHRSLLTHGAAAGCREIGWMALETLRIEAGRPRYGSDITDEIIPTEAFESSGLLSRAVSFTKGCYTGQEVIVRIAHRGRVNKHLRGLVLAPGAATPDRGSRLFHPESAKEIGWITSVTDSPLVGAVIALGYVRRELGPGDVVVVGAADGPRANVVELPFRKAADAVR